MNHAKAHHVVGSIFILIAWWMVAGFVSIMPRVTPPGGVGPFDVIIIVSLPYVAYLAGKRWYNGLVFLVFGLLGTMLFYYRAFLGNNRLYIDYANGSASPAGDLTKWVVGGLIMGIICHGAGSLASDPPLAAQADQDSPDE
jgi:hypothetical protein